MKNLPNFMKLILKFLSSFYVLYVISFENILYNRH